MWAFIPICDSTLLKFVVPVLGGYEKGVYDIGPFEIYLDTQAVGMSF